MEKRFLICGSGGQGILFMGRIIAQAALIDGREVTWFPSYGAEMRCGTANCTVIVSDDIIGSPVITTTDVLVVFTEVSLKKYMPRLDSGGMLFYDSSLLVVEGVGNGTGIGIRASSMAKELGSTKVANMIMLGAIVALTGAFSIETIISALESDSSECMLHTLSLNKQAVQKGYEIVANQKSPNL